MVSGPLGAQVALDVVTTTGARTVFALAGAQHARLLLALERAGVRVVGTRSEAATVGAADGYARLAGRPGFALIIAGQGVVNALAGFATAFEARSPVVVVIARSPLGHEDPLAPSYHTSGAFLAAVSKAQIAVEDPDTLGECLEKAVVLATASPAGPVAVTVPADFLSTPVALREPATGPAPAAGPVEVEAPGADLAGAAAILAAGTRPVVIAGTGMRRAGAGRAAAALRAVRDLGIPVLLECEAKGLVAEDMDLVHPWPFAQTAVGAADVVVLAGCALTGRLGGGRPPRFAPGARFIQLDDDPAEFGRGSRARLGIGGSPARSLAFLAGALRAGGTRGAGGSWLVAALGERSRAVASVPDSGPGGLHPYAIARRLGVLAESPAIVVGDGADTLSWMHGEVRLGEGSVWMDHQPLGSMGVGLPLALGACAAEQEERTGEPARPVVLVTGDGALGYNVAEIETAARCDLPVRILVCNDAAWGTERHGQIKKLGRAVNTDLSLSAYEQVAQGLGARGMRAETEEDLDLAVKEMVDHVGPVLVNVVVDRESGRLRKEEPLVEMIFYDELALDQATRRSGGGK